MDWLYRYLRSFSSSDQVKGRGGRVRCRFGFHCRGNYLVVVYIFVKLLYLINVVAQLFLLDMFLATPFHAYGIEVIALLILVQWKTGSPLITSLSDCTLCSLCIVLCVPFTGVASYGALGHVPPRLPTV